MKRFILLGCGPAVTRLISQPGTGIRNLSCPDIIYQTGVLYGDASSTTIDKWTASLIVPYASADTFTTVLGAHNATHIKLANAHQPLSESSKISNLKLSFAKFSRGLESHSRLQEGFSPHGGPNIY